MFRVGSWLYGKKPASTQSLDSLSELRDLEDAMRGMSNFPCVIESPLFRGQC
ncbi:uncharacterized protein BO88DRAFT_409209 [Aspergillus vadensis CBS 113365]|uniref:Uncharacterized protein n=1 Tax=Aspergillus vadensis (strain CBS 113365 / IMI 142717 / IBT 24658) TaxID=1448311 RepID=A0A319AV08_ASPVC|nr:hypothetical protein BO88DRAFT_409209 [Aspergillus vadensis CBS 113365]PYH63424.1 hypothetical protein BO88DRAFT_409209 [Aspergillus vadensis CBS 113365]